MEYSTERGVFTDGFDLSVLLASEHRASIVATASLFDILDFFKPSLRIFSLFEMHQAKKRNE